MSSSAPGARRKSAWATANPTKSIWRLARPGSDKRDRKGRSYPKREAERKETREMKAASRAAANTLLRVGEAPAPAAVGAPALVPLASPPEGELDLREAALTAREQKLAARERAVEGRATQIERQAAALAKEATGERAPPKGAGRRLHTRCSSSAFHPPPPPLPLIAPAPCVSGRRRL